MRCFTRFTVCLLSTLLLFSCNPSTTTQQQHDLQGKVVRIADGDTFTLLTENNEQVKVRLHGIDCPEKAQDYGQVARQRLSDLVFGKEVGIDIKDKDRYGRTVAIAYTPDGVCVNEALLREGLAWHYSEYDKNEDWSRLEAEARAGKIGLWSKPRPVRPSQFRKRK